MKQKKIKFESLETVFKVIEQDLRNSRLMRFWRRATVR